MFEQKVICSGQASHRYLEQYRYYLTIKGLNQDQYANFQTETLELLADIHGCIDYILKYIESESKYGYILDCSHLKETIYSVFNSSERSSSRFLLDTCNELISSVNHHIVFNTSIAPTAELTAEVKRISQKNTKLREYFKLKSSNSQDLLAAVKPFNENRAYEKCQVIEELTSKISDFSKISIFNIADDDSHFLMDFYYYYNQKLNRESMSVDAPDSETILSQIKQNYDHDPVVVNALSALDELKKFDFDYIITADKNVVKRVFKIFKRKQNKKIYDRINSIMNDYFEYIDKTSANYRYCTKCLSKLKKSLSWGKYKKASKSLAYIENTIEDKTLFSEKNRVVDEYLASQAKENSIFEFINSNCLIGIVINENVQEEINECSLLNVFYECYKGLKTNELSDEELIELIDSNRTTILNFINELIKTLESEPNFGKNPVNKLIDIDNYYEFMRENRNVTEQEVIDNTLKRLYLGGIKGE